MKIHLAPRAAVHGAAILVSLLICTILAVSVASYLSLTMHQYNLSMRSQEWNTSMAVVEAGIEEGLQHLNENTTNLATCGWTAAGNNTYVMERTLDSGSKY